MSRLRLSYGGCDYWDRSHSLIDETVKPEGIDLNYIVVTLHDLFRRMASHEEFDVAEMSMSTFVALASRGDQRFIAIPVFPSRNFRHSYLFINTRAGIERPEDLRDKRVGVVEYQMTAALWIRGVLQHDYGVHPREIKWSTGGMNRPGYVERAPISLPKEIDLKKIPENRDLEEMLEKGDLDALISPKRPQALVEGRGSVARMFPDYRNVEKEYYRRTGIFPIMHTVVIRRSVYEANRWIVASLFDAFERAKQLGQERIQVTGPLAVALPWIPSDLEEIEEVFGGTDPWVYGIEPNRKVLETLIRYSYEQGLSARPMSLDELFAEESFVPPAIGQAA